MLCRALLVMASQLMVSSWGFAAELPSPVDRSQSLVRCEQEFGLPDGPSDDGRGSLYVPDVKGQALYRLRLNTNKWDQVLTDCGTISATTFQLGTLYVSHNSTMSIARLDGQALVPIATLDDGQKPPAKPNDLAVRYDGQIFATVTARNQVVRIDPTGQIHVATTAVAAPNGIALSPDGRTLYVSAYKAKQVMACAVAADGSLSEPRLFASMDDGEALGADGMCVDRAGNVYCTGATDVWIWNPRGELLDKITTPQRPINCEFSGAQQRVLFITTFGGVYQQPMRISGLSTEPAPQAGEPDAPGGRQLETRIPADVTAHLNVPYAEYGARSVLMDVFLPAGNTPRPAVLVVHGGGWQNGDKTKFRALAIDLARRGFVAAAIEYRLADEALYPAAIHDCAAAVRFLRAHASDYHMNPDQIAAVGGSAGGHLVGLLGTGSDDPTICGTGGWADQSSRVQAVVVMAGPMLMASGSVAERSKAHSPDSNSNRWLGKSIDEDPAIYRHADADLRISADDPPMLFLVGELDDPQRYESTAARLTAVNVPTQTIVYPQAKHGCWMMYPWFTQMNDDMAAFLHQHLQ